MAENTQQPPNKNNDGTWVATHEPDARPAPVFEKGIFAWMRDNLFSSEINIVLTFVGLFLAIFSIVGVWTWTVEQGNWFVITFNFRTFMLNQYSPQFEWRAVIALLSAVFVTGMAIAVWVKQVARGMLIFMIVTLVVIWGLPPLTTSIYEHPAWFPAVGTAEITSGSATEVPIDQIAFSGQAGDEIVIQLSEQAAANDAALAALTGFLDVSTNTLRNAADNRLDAINQENTIYLDLQEDENSLAEENIPTLTDGQRETLVDVLANFEVPQRIVEQYSINAPVEGDTGAVQIDIVEAVYLGDNQWEYSPLTADAGLLQTFDDEIRYTLPRDSWYVLEKSIIGSEDKIAVLRVQGIYPVLQSTSFNTEVEAFVDVFRRMTDFYTNETPIPRMNGETLPFNVIIQNQFRGDREFGTYMRTYVAPFLERHALNTTIIMIIGIIGYAAAIVMQNTTQKGFASEFTSYAMMSLPIIIWVLVNGLSLAAVAMWALLFGVVLVSSAIGTYGRKVGYSGYTVIIAAVIIYALLFGVTWMSDGGGLAKWLVYLSFIPIFLSAFLGANAYLPDAKLDEGEEPRMYTNFGIATLIYIGVLAAVFLGWVSVETEWALTPTNADAWGGFLLTIILTIFGIILAFPIGVGLALGRRSDLPAVSAICTGYIELVRGSPFITVLFFMQLLIPLINSEFANVPNSYRALVAVVLFSAAYLAENIRGGLQSLPPGQVEAAKALGLNAWQTTRLITMPQALRAVIPALVGQFISLFKDTSLVAIVGLTDLTRVVNTIVVQAAFIGTRREGLLFISIIYFVFSYVMSYVSRLLEASGSGSTRRM